MNAKIIIKRIVKIIEDGIYIGKKHSWGLGYIQGNVIVNRYENFQAYSNKKLGNYSKISYPFKIKIIKPTSLYHDDLAYDLTKRYATLANYYNLTLGKNTINVKTAEISRISTFQKPGKSTILSRPALLTGTFLISVNEDFLTNWIHLLRISNIFFDDVSSPWCRCCFEVVITTIDSESS